MKRVIKHILKEITSDFEVRLCPEHVEGDFTINILFKHYALKDKVISLLNESELIDSIEENNRYLNITLTERLLESNHSDQNNVLMGRLKEVSNRLLDEGYKKGQVPRDFLPLLKAYNCMVTLLKFDDLKERDIKNVILTFNDLDTGYIYRKLSPDELGGLSDLLKHVIDFFEGK